MSQDARPETDDVVAPLARYAPFRRAGDLVYFAGITAANQVTGRTVTGFDDLPDDVAKELGRTGELSVDAKDGPILAQSWVVLDGLRRTVQSAGGTLDDVVNLTQYFCDLRDFPLYNRVRTSFFVQPPASSVIGVREMLPTPATLLEVQAVAHIPERR